MWYITHRFDPYFGSFLVRSILAPGSLLSFEERKDSPLQILFDLFHQRQSRHPCLIDISSDSLILPFMVRFKNYRSSIPGVYRTKLLTDLSLEAPKKRLPLFLKQYMHVSICFQFFHVNSLNSMDNVCKWLRVITVMVNRNYGTIPVWSSESKDFKNRRSCVECYVFVSISLVAIFILPFHLGIISQHRSYKWAKAGFIFELEVFWK